MGPGKRVTPFLGKFRQKFHTRSTVTSRMRAYKRADYVLFVFLRRPQDFHPKQHLTNAAGTGFKSGSAFYFLLLKCDDFQRSGSELKVAAAGSSSQASYQRPSARHSSFAFFSFGRASSGHLLCPHSSRLVSTHIPRQHGRHSSSTILLHLA